MVYGAPFVGLWADVLALVVTVVVGFVLATRFFRWEPKAT